MSGMRIRLLAVTGVIFFCGIIYAAQGVSEQLFEILFLLAEALVLIGVVAAAFLIPRDDPEKEVRSAFRTVLTAAGLVANGLVVGGCFALGIIFLAIRGHSWDPMYVLHLFLLSATLLLPGIVFLIRTRVARLKWCAVLLGCVSGSLLFFLLIFGTLPGLR